MRKNRAFWLVLCLCAGLCFAAAAESLETTLSFQGVSVEVPNSVIGFRYPETFTVTELTEEEKARGVLLNAQSADPAYSLRVTLSPASYETLLAKLQETSDVTDVKDYTINGVDYLGYTVPSQGLQVGVVFLGENCDQALSFAFAIPDGATPGRIPLEIMGSLYEL